MISYLFGSLIFTIIWFVFLFFHIIKHLLHARHHITCFRPMFSCPFLIITLWGSIIPIYKWGIKTLSHLPRVTQQLRDGAGSQNKQSQAKPVLLSYWGGCRKWQEGHWSWGWGIWWGTLGKWRHSLPNSEGSCKGQVQVFAETLCEKGYLSWVCFLPLLYYKSNS